MSMYWSGGAGCVAVGKGPSEQCPCDGCRRFTEDQRALDALPGGRFARILLGALALGMYKRR